MLNAVEKTLALNGSLRSVHQINEKYFLLAVESPLSTEDSQMIQELNSASEVFFAPVTNIVLGKRCAYEQLV